jgi:hypothetical protein
VAASAGRATTVTPSIASSVAPDMTASKIAWSRGEVVWWTTSSVGIAVKGGLPARVGATAAPRRAGRLYAAAGPGGTTWPEVVAMGGGRTGMGVAAAVVGAAAVGQWLGRTAGSSRAERRRPLPGDELVDRPTVVTNHAVTIPAPPSRVWPWLVQMGWHRGGWYTARWVDRLLFPANWPSATRLVPELQRPLLVGDRIPDGPPGTAWFAVAHVDAPHLLVLRSTTHLPPAWRARLGASIDWTWTFTLTGSGDGGTRLLLRVRGRTGPWWLTAAYVGAVVPADSIMATSMLNGIRRRALQPGAVRLPGWWCGGRGRRRPRPGGSPRAWSGCWTRSS